MVVMIKGRVIFVEVNKGLDELGIISGEIVPVTNYTDCVQWHQPNI
jgi:hypothetical protein